MDYTLLSYNDIFILLTDPKNYTAKLLGYLPKELSRAFGVPAFLFWPILLPLNSGIYVVDGFSIFAGGKQHTQLDPLAVWIIWGQSELNTMCQSEEFVFDREHRLRRRQEICIIEIVLFPCTRQHCSLIDIIIWLLPSGCLFE